MRLVGYNLRMKTPKTGRVTRAVSFRLSEESLKGLQALAQAQRRTRVTVLEILIEEAVQRAKKGKGGQ